MNWLGLARQWTERRHAAGRRAENALGWWNSLDLAWFVIAASGLFILAALGGLLAWLQIVHGLFDGPLIQPTPDARILNNIRATPSPFADAAVVTGDNALFAARRNGTVHRLDLSSRLWSEEPFDPAHLFTSAIAILQPGCGYRVPNPACAEAGSLYAVTEAGGIAVRGSGGWRMLAGDNWFEGLDGKPVAQSDIPSMAPAGRGRFLVFGTERQGIGLFDTEQKRWLTVPADVQARIFGAAGPAAPRIERLAADAQDRVWVGTSTGVGILSGLGRRLEGMRVAELKGETLDMLPEPDGGMLVLGIEPCPGVRSESDGACTALRRVDRRGSRVETVAGETERNEFDEVDIRHVAVIGRRIRAFGPKGVYDYIEESRRWELVCRGEVTAIWQGTSGGLVVYAQNQDPDFRAARCHKGPPGDEKIPGTIVTTVQPDTGKEASWKIPDERIDHIALGGDGLPWLLARPGSNRVFVLRADGPHEIAEPSQIAAGSPLLTDKTTVAVEVEGRILFAGATGAALHDPVTRTWRFIDRADRPEELVAPGARLLAEGNVVWVVSRESWIAAVKVYAGSTTFLDRIPRHDAGPNARITSAQITPRGLLLTTSTGGFYLASVTVQNVIQMTPVLGPAPSRPIGPLVDALAGADGVLVADHDGIFHYDARRRGWSGPSGGLKGEAIAGLAQANSGVFVLGSGGSVSYETGGMRLFGDGAPFPFGRSEMTDAWFADQRLFLAAAGRVAVYDTVQRRHVDQWDLPAGPLQIAGVVNGQPVVWDRKGAWHGRRRLMVDDRAWVTSASVADDKIITLQRDDQGAFLAEFNGRNSNPRCLFRETEAAQGPMLDVRPLALPQQRNGATAVLGPDRLRVYAPSQRRWVPVAEVATSPAARLADLGNHLAVYDREKLTLVPLTGAGALQLPDSCSWSPAAAAAIVTVDGSQVAVDEAGRRAAVLERDGRIREWTSSQPQFVPVLGAPGAGPRTPDLKRAVQDGRTIHFAAPDGIWSYDLDARAWGHRRLTAAAHPNDPVHARSLSLALLPDGLALSLRDDRDRDWGGVIANAGDIDHLSEIGPGPAIRAPFDPARLIDAAELSPRHWLFLAAGVVAAFDAGAVKWKWAPAPEIGTQGIGTPGAALVRFGGGPVDIVAVAEGDPGRPARLTFLPFDLAEPGGDWEDSAGAAPLRPSTVNNSFRPSRDERYAVATSGIASGGPAAEERGPQIVRVLATNEVQSCPIARSGEVRPCDTLLPAALTVEAGSVAAAWSFDGATLIVTAGSWWKRQEEVRLIDRLHRRTLPRPDLPDIDPARTTAYEVGNQLWIRDRGGRIRAISRNGEVRLIAADSGAVRAIGGAVWALRGGLARRAGRDGAIEDPADILRRAARPDVSPKAFLPQDDGRIHVLTAAGEVFAIGRDGQIEPGALDLSGLFNPGEVRSAVLISAGHAWIQHGDMLSLIEADDCRPTRAGHGRVTPRPCLREAVRRPIPTALPADAILRAVDGDQFVFETAAYGYDNRAKAWRRIDNVPGIGADVPAAPDLKDELTAAVSGGRLDVAVIEQDRPEVSISRPSLPGLSPLRFFGAMTGERLPALGDSGGPERWLHYDRTARQFVVRSAQPGSIAVSAAELFPGGVFAPTLAGRSVISGAQEFVHANESGLWTFPLRHDWIGNGPSWTRIRLPPVVTAAHGRFYFNTGSIAVDGARVQPDEQDYVLANDGLTIRENIRNESIAATIDIAGRPADALAATGFIHDQRLGIAFDRGGVIIVTPAGLVGARDFHARMPPPGWAAAGSGDAVLFNADGLLYAKAGGRVYRAEGGEWREAGGDPRSQPRTLASESGRDWVRRGDTVVIQGDGWRTRLSTGWRFAADQLEGATHAVKGGILAVTQEGIVDAPDLDSLASAGPPRRMPAGAKGVLERRFRAPGDPVVGFVYQEGPGRDRLSRFLDEASEWVAPAGPDDPLISRAAVRTSLLTIAFRNNQAVVEAAAERPEGGATSVAVDWRKDEHFPFDQAIAIAAEGATLYVGTEAGLVVTAAASPAARARLIDTGAGDHVPVRVDRIGRPAGAPARLVVRSGAGCLDVAGGTIARCTDPQALDERWLGATGYWKWTARAAPEMVYLDSSGRPVGRPVTSVAGGFPHDHPSAAIDCPAGGRISLWDDGLALEVAADNAAPGPPSARAASVLAVSAPTAPAEWKLDGAVVSDLRPYFKAAPAALHCQPALLRLSGGTVITPGIRVLSPASGLVAFRDSGASNGASNDRWRIEADAVANAVIARWRGAVPYDHARLRLVDPAALAGGSERKGVELQYFTRSQRWRPLKATGGRYLVDERRRIVSAGGVPYVLTPEGLVRLEKGAGYRFNPDTIDIITVPCEVDRIETADGTGLALAAEPGAPTLVRCRDGTVLQGRLDGAGDDNVFADRHGSDPFAERLVASTGTTAWRIADRSPGQAGHVEVVWRDERLHLSGGRFALDVWTSIAHLSGSEFIEMASGQGWIRSPLAHLSLSMSQAQRPAVPLPVAEGVRRLAADVDPDRREVLCLLDQGGQTAIQRVALQARRAPDVFDGYEPRDCGRFAGDEGGHGPWIYRSNIRTPSPLTMRAQDQSGAPVDRVMSDGRFNDLVATGAPLAYAAQGEVLTVVPTRAGISRFAATGDERPLRTTNGTAAIALLAAAGGDLAVLTPDGFSGAGELRQACPIERKVDGLGAIRFGALALSGDGLIELSGRRGAGRVFYSISCGAGDPVVLPWWIAVPVSGRRRVTANRLPWDRVWLSWAAGQLAAGAVRPSPDLVLRGNLPAPLRLLNGGDRLFAVFDADVIEVATDPLVSALDRRR